MVCFVPWYYFFLDELLILGERWKVLVHYLIFEVKNPFKRKQKTENKGCSFDLGNVCIGALVIIGEK